LEFDPNDQGQLNPLQMRVFEGGWVLEAEAQHPAHTDMGEPDERNMNARRPPGSECQGYQEGRQRVGMDSVLDPTAEAGIDLIANHRQVWSEKEQPEQQSACALADVQGNRAE
jgi:hypothetical protein